MSAVNSSMKLTLLIGSLIAALCCPALAWPQDRVSALPKNYKVVFDNPDITVLRAHYGPHEKIPMHNHPSYPTVFIYLNDSGVVRISHSDSDGGKVTPIDRPPTHGGAFRIAPGHTERHSVENLADVPADSVLVELKALPPEAISKEFRGPAPEQPLRSGATTVFDSSALRIERVICDPGATCTLDARPAPSVLIAVTPVALFGDVQSQMLTLEQPSSRLGTGQKAGMRSLGPVPAQVLRLELLAR